MLRAFSVCVNYSDILKLVYSFNKSFFNSYHIITSPTDIKTQQFCKDNNIDYICSDVYKINESSFNKAAMLNQILEYLEEKYPDDWFLSMDVDIIIECQDKNFLENLNKNYIYGCRRKVLDDLDYFKDGITWDKIRKPDIGYMHSIGNLPYAQVGYFQLFYKKGCRFNTKYTTASDCDTDFFYDNFNLNSTETFDMNFLMCYHLGPIEQNWSGRISKEWIINA